MASLLSLASLLLLSYLLSLASLLLLALLLFYPPENVEVRDVPFFPSAVFIPAVADIIGDTGVPLIRVVCAWRPCYSGALFVVDIPFVPGVAGVPDAVSVPLLASLLLLAPSRIYTVVY